MRRNVAEGMMDKCSRERCFGNKNGRCVVLTDTEGQKTCRFYRDDLDLKKINKEIEKNFNTRYKL